MTWQAALDTCNNLVYADHDDWRLPNVQELHSLMDYGQSDPSLPLGNHFVNVQLTNYWSSTTVDISRVNAWVVRMIYGSVFGDDKDINEYYVWPVPGGQ